MKFFNTYIIPLALFILAIVNLKAQRWVEAALYLSVGSGFVIMNLLRNGTITQNKKFWNIVSWVLVALAVILFFLVLRIDAYEL